MESIMSRRLFLRSADNQPTSSIINHNDNNNNNKTKVEHWTDTLVDKNALHVYMYTVYSSMRSIYFLVQGESPKIHSNPDGVFACCHILYYYFGILLLYTNEYGGGVRVQSLSCGCYIRRGHTGGSFIDVRVHLLYTNYFVFYFVGTMVMMQGT